MSRSYADIAFTEAVAQVQERHGSRTFYDRRRARSRSANGAADALTADEREKENRDLAARLTAALQNTARPAVAPGTAPFP